VAKNLRRVSRLDIAGGGQVYVEGNHCYIGHMKPPHGTTILDVSDPKNPKVVAELKLSDHQSHTHKVRVIGDLMITNVEQNNRHFVRRGDRIPGAREKLAKLLGREATDAEIAKEIGVKEADIAVLEAQRKRGYHEGGFKVWNVRDKSNPKLLHYQKTHGFGVHRFDMDANYAYISTEMEGYIGNILVIYDLAKPDKPAEVSRWWMQGQQIAGGEKPTWQGYKNWLHHTLRHKDQLWAAVWHAGLRVIDVSDITKPKTVGFYDYHPPFPEPTHTVLRVPFPVAGRELAVAVDEEHEHVPGQPHAGMWVFDVGDLANIKPLSMFHVSELDSPYARAPGRFGAHQFQEHMRPGDTRLYTSWFGGGLRIIDIAKPETPTETGWYIPEPASGQPSPQSNDVEVDSRGLVYLLDRNVGLEILEVTG
jgi:hypothetical protein